MYVCRLPHLVSQKSRSPSSPSSPPSSPSGRDDSDRSGYHTYIHTTHTYILYMHSSIAMASVCSTAAVAGDSSKADDVFRQMVTP